MPVLHNIGRLITCRAQDPQEVLHEYEGAALVWEGEHIAWVGLESDLPESYQSMERWDAQGCMVIPGLIDCHTHLAFGGWRADEFEQRIKGRSYLEIAQRGGGIMSTVEQTRQVSLETLILKSEAFLREMGKLGVTTVECKSGYGLNTRDELKQLYVYKALRQRQPIRIVSTFLAHMVPPSYQIKRAAYVARLRNAILPKIIREELAEFCDVFVEESAFTIEEARSILNQGKQYGLRPKLHADQLTNSRGAELAAQVGAISADHLEYISDEGIEAMHKADVVAVSLPLATLYLNQPPMPARKLIEAGVSVAVATDFNPGSAPSYHLPLAMMLACTLQRMTPIEALKGATLYAAKAIGLDDEIGSLEVGKSADFVVLDTPNVNHWLYHFRPNSAIQTVAKGHVL